MRPYDDELTQAEIDQLGTLLVAERPRPTERFAAELDARVERRFTGPLSQRSAERAPRRRFRLPLGPAGPALAATLAVALVALVVVLDTTGGPRRESPAGGATSSPGLTEQAPPASADSAAPDEAAGGSRSAQGSIAPSQDLSSQGQAATGLPNATRKVQRSASLDLATAPDRLDDVARDVLAIVARFDGIVDRSAVQSVEQSGDAAFLLRVPAGRLQPALAALSRIPDTDVVARADETTDVNQAYVSIRRQLANARAERQGLLRALAAADTEDETLRLRFRLDAVERTIARAERNQRALDRRIDYSRISVSVRTDAGGPDDGAGTFTPGRALDDAGRVLAVALGVAIVAAAALVPVATLVAIGWALAAAARHRRREQAPT